MNRTILPQFVLAAFFCLIYADLELSAQGKYQTFDFLDFDVKILTEHEIDQQNVEHLKSSITRQLEAKGLTQAADPDLAVNICVVV